MRALLKLAAIAVLGRSNIHLSGRLLFRALLFLLPDFNPAAQFGGEIRFRSYVMI